MIDGAMPTSAPLIQSSIRRLGFQPKDVKILLNTHAHFDHTGGLADLKRDTSARLLANPADRKALETGTYPGWEDMRGLDFAPVKVDGDLKDGQPVRLGDAVLFRHAKAGELCERFAEIVVVEGERIVERVPTYRGLGGCFF